jgi:Domain of unknown function (DUF4190)
MGTPGDRDEGPREGGWQSEWQSGGGGWQSQWQQPGAQQPGEQGQPSQQPQGGGGTPGWQQTADGQWVQTGAAASSGKSTAALVLGILGLVFCPLICSVLALVFGYQSRREIDASGGRMSGRGNATAGIVLGWIGVALTAIFIVLIIIGVLAGDSGSTSGTGLPS